MFILQNIIHEEKSAPVSTNQRLYIRGECHQTVSMLFRNWIDTQLPYGALYISFPESNYRDTNFKLKSMLVCVDSNIITGIHKEYNISFTWLIDFTYVNFIAFVESAVRQKYEIHKAESRIYSSCWYSLCIVLFKVKCLCYLFQSFKVYLRRCIWAVSKFLEFILNDKFKLFSLLTTSCLFRIVIKVNS